MDLLPFPPSAAWRHVDARDGFECVFAAPAGDGGTWLRGHTSAVEDGEAWWVGYDIRLDARWCTREVHVRNRTAAGEGHVHLEADGEGRWLVDGAPAPALDGCVDVDLEASACTNTLPVHRVAFAAGEPVEAPAAYVRALDVGTMRLDQVYTLVAPPPPGEGPRFDYASPTFSYADRLAYDPTGLVTTYPHLATRIA